MRSRSEPVVEFVSRTPRVPSASHAIADTDAGLTDLIPVQGMRSNPHLDFAGEIRAATGFPTFHAAKIQDVTTARHAIASGNSNGFVPQAVDPERPVAQAKSSAFLPRPDDGERD